MPPIAADAPAIRVMLVEDSGVARALMTRWIEDSGRARVAAVACNGRAALDMLAAQDMDVVVLDVEMPELDGLSALPQMLALRPGLQVLMASGLTERGARTSLEALRLGAADTIAKPRAGWATADGPAFRQDLIARIVALGEARRTMLALPEAGSEPSPPPRAARLRDALPRPALVLIGASTGGPRALFRMAELLPAGMPVPLLITQHMPEKFTAIFAEQLGRAGACPAHEARHGMIAQAGHLYLAPGNRHMLVERHGEQVRIQLSDAPPENFCKPSVNPLFASAADAFGPRALALMLTGMGSDGLAGARALVAAGGRLLAQDSATSVVWGMPGSVVRAGLASDVMSIDELANRLADLVPGAVARGSAC